MNTDMNPGQPGNEVAGVVKRRSLEEILVSLGVKESFVRNAVNRQRVAKKPLQDVARDTGLVSGEKIAEALGVYTGYPYFPAMDAENIDPVAIERITTILGENFSFNGFIPVGFDANDNLRVAIPGTERETEARNTFARYKPVICVASQKTIQKVYRMFFAKTAEFFDHAVDEAIRAMKSNGDEIGGDNAIQRAIAALLRHTCYVGASDIYMWSSPMAGTIKLKIGGRGEPFRSIDKELFDRMVNFLVMSSGKQEDLNRAPQDAKVQLKATQVQEEFSDILTRYVFRMSLVQAPGSDRERTVVIRANDSQSAEADFDALGFDENTSNIIKRYSASPTGLVLVTGPTGSGKTTSLYAILREIDPLERAVFTMEKPIEYRHGSWIQHELGQEQSEGDEARVMLKALLRSAPDVILIGELRDDPDLIKTALAAANTGHLVFTTLHTNDAPSAIMRLTELGARKEVLAAVLNGVLAQRLVSLLCEKCKVPDDRRSTMDELNKPYLVHSKKTPYISTGCPHCNYAGSRGRTMVYELMDANAVREQIEIGASLTEMRKHAYSESASMWGKGLMMVADGLISMDELVKRVTRPNS